MKPSREAGFFVERAGLAGRPIHGMPLREYGKELNV